MKPFCGLSRGTQAILSGFEQIRTIFSGFLLDLLHLMALLLTCGAETPLSVDNNVEGFAAAMEPVV